MKKLGPHIRRILTYRIDTPDVLWKFLLIVLIIGVVVGAAVRLVRFQKEQKNAIRAQIEKVERVISNINNEEVTEALSRGIMTRTIEERDYSKLVSVKMFGMEFKTPWGTWTHDTPADNPNMTHTISFKNGYKISTLVSNGPISYYDQFVNHYGVEEAEKLASVFGPGFRSNFEAKKIIMSSSPEVLKGIKSRKEAEVRARAVLIKSSTLPALGQIYEAHKDGFDILIYTGKKVTPIEFYSKDGWVYTVALRLDREATSEEINTVISTFEIK
jgi:hypothetical protein